GRSLTAKLYCPSASACAVIASCPDSNVASMVAPGEARPLTSSASGSTGPAVVGANELGGAGRVVDGSGVGEDVVGVGVAAPSDPESQPAIPITPATASSVNKEESLAFPLRRVASTNRPSSCAAPRRREPYWSPFTW